MAQSISVAIYQINSNPPLASTITFGFPTATCLFRPAPSGMTINGTNILSIIQTLDGTQYYSELSVSGLITLANA